MSSYEIPDYLVSIIFTSLDLRLKERKEAIEKMEPASLMDFAREHDDISGLLKQAQACLERQAPKGVCKKIYTEKEK